MSPNYKLTDEDILNNRKRTETITELVFNIGEHYWHLIDVAGQRDKRSRWTTYLDKKLNSIIYIISAPSYCQVLEECPESNRLSDALELFQSLLDNPIIQTPSYIVFMNKIDLLKQRLATHPVSEFIPAYQGDFSSTRP